MTSKSEEIQYSDDLPDSVKSQLVDRGPGVGKVRGVLLRLIGENSGIDINGLIIGLYRSNGIEIKRSGIQTHLKKLRDKDLVESPERGLFKLTDKGEEYFERATRAE